MFVPSRAARAQPRPGGNYAASLKATFDAAEKGFDQVLWLDGRENKYVEEVGAMNMMFVMDGKIVTAPLEGNILAGITRKSILQLAQDKGYETEERRISVAELFEAYERGGLTEAFGHRHCRCHLPSGRTGVSGQVHGTQQPRDRTHFPGNVQQPGGYPERRAARYPQLGHEAVTLFQQNSLRSYRSLKPGATSVAPVTALVRPSCRCRMGRTSSNIAV